MEKTQTLILKETLLENLPYNLIKKMIFALTLLLAQTTIAFANPANPEKSVSIKTKKANPKADAAEKQHLSENLALAEKMEILLRFDIDLKPELKPWYHMVPYYLSLSVAAILCCFLIGQGLVISEEQISKSTEATLQVQTKIDTIAASIESQKQNLAELSKEFQSHFQLVAESFSDLNKQLRDSKPPTDSIPPLTSSSQKHFSNIIEG